MSEGTGEPSNADLLAAIQALAAKIDGVGEKVDQVAQDVMAVKVDTGFLDRHIADFQAWARRHQADPNAHRPAA